MDLSHTIGLWLAGQSSPGTPGTPGSDPGTAGVAPGGVAVVYAPFAASRRDAGPASRCDAAKEGGTADQRGGVGVYPFSAGRLVLGEVSRGKVPVPRIGAGLALIGELEYGPDGLEGFVPRLWSAVQMGVCGLGSRVSGEDEGGMIGAAVNQGAASIGLSDRLQFVDRFDAEGVLGRARVVGFMERDGEVDQTCDDIAVASFPLMYGKLDDYLRFAVSAQVAGNGYDDLAGVLAKCDRPTHAVVVVGVAASLRDAGPALRSNAAIGVGDVCHSVVYDAEVVTLDEIEGALRGGDAGVVLDREGVSWLRQVVG